MSLGDMDPEEFRKAAHRVADQVADYLADLERYRVLPDLRPGEIRAQLPARPHCRASRWTRSSTTMPA